LLKYDRTNSRIQAVTVRDVTEKQNLTMTKKILFNFKEREKRHNCYSNSQAHVSYMLYIYFFCLHSMARPKVGNDREGPQIRSVASNILNTQSRTTDKG